ncbi:MAG TPA: hypothetical protein VHQ86_05290, partial [Candidatus Saccharimonadia bacterium]|nr:hypothetical protein [Candidatus Saccharimonadia bacterium]
MKQLFNDSNLTAMAVPVTPAKQHQLQLKRALLSSGPHKSKGWRSIMSKKPLLISGLTFGIAVVALTAGAFIAPQGSTASAQGLAKDSAKAVAQLSPAAKQALLTFAKADVDDQINAAQTAKNLETLTYDQVVSKYAHLLPPKDDK